MGWGGSGLLFEFDWEWGGGGLGWGPIRGWVLINFFCL